MISRYAEWVLGHRLFIIVTTLILVLSMAYGGQHIRLTTDYRVFFSAENPQLQAFEKLQKTYTKDDNVLFILAPRDGKVFSAETLQAVIDLTEKAWQIPYSIRVDSVSNYQHTYAEEDDLVVEDLVMDVGSMTAGDYAATKAVALTEPMLLHRLISEQAHVTGVNVTIQLPGINQVLEVPEVAQFSRDLARQIRTNYPDIDVHMTGMIFMNNAFSEASMEDMQGLVPLMFVMIILVMATLLRSITATLVTVVVIILSIMTAMGLTGWMGIELTPPSASAPTIIMTLAVANCVHVLTNYLHGIRIGMLKHEAMLESLRINIQPIFLTSVTTAIGFLSMNFSDAPPFHDLGNIVAMGVGAAFFLSLLFLPAVMVLLPVKAYDKPSSSGQLMERLSMFVIKRQDAMLWGVGGLALLLLAFVPANELNDEFVKYFDESVEFRQATDFSTSNLTGIYNINYSLGAEGAGGISDPAYLARVEAFVEWYRQQPGVIHVNSITDTLKRLNKNLHGDDQAWYRLPQQRDLAAQYLLLYEMSLPYGLDLNNQLNVDKSATKITATLESLSSNDLLALEEQAQRWMRTNLPEYMWVEGSSPSIMFAHIGKRNITSMLIGTTVALILISMILIIALRSIRIGLISMVPNLLPAAMAFGLWGLWVGEIGLALSIVTGMTLGIVVDDTVHFLSKYLRARREKQMDAEDAVHYAFSTVGRALWITSMVLIAGFMVLSLSVFKLNSGMGIMSAITIAFALVADFLFLPALLMKLDRKRI